MVDNICAWYVYDEFPGASYIGRVDCMIPIDTAIRGGLIETGITKLNEAALMFLSLSIEVTRTAGRGEKTDKTFLVLIPYLL